MKLKWTVEFEVDACWIADGFDLDDGRALEMLAQDLSHAHYSELGAKVVARPDPETFAKAAQGELGELVS